MYVVPSMPPPFVVAHILVVIHTNGPFPFVFQPRELDAM